MAHTPRSVKGFVQIESPFALPFQFTSNGYYLLKLIAPGSYIFFLVETLPVSLTMSNE